MLNNAKPIVPPMQNVVGDTHAETRREIEARARAEQAQLAALQQKANKKSPISTVLALIFGFLAIAAIGFSVYEYLENDKLKAELQDAQSRYLEADARNTELSETNSKLRAQNAALEEELKALKDPSEATDNEGVDNADATDDSANE